MPTPILPNLTDLANIRTALNLYYYGQDVPTGSPTVGLAKELGDLRTGVSTVQTTLADRKPPKLVAQATPPPGPDTANNAGGLWIDTSTSTPGPTATLLYYWDATSSTWVAASGKAREDIGYSWTGPHVFKSTLNYFANSTARDAAITTPVQGQLAVVSNRVQLRTASAWSDVSIPPGGTSGQALVKTSSIDFEANWSSVAALSANNVFTGFNTFSGTAVFSAKPTMSAGLDITGNTTMGNLNSSGTLSVTGAITANSSFTLAGQATLNGKTIVKNDAARDSGFFMGTRRVYIQPTQPSGAAIGDIWIPG